MSQAKKHSPQRWAKPADAPGAVQAPLERNRLQAALGEIDVPQFARPTAALGRALRDDEPSTPIESEEDAVDESRASQVRRRPSVEAIELPAEALGQRSGVADALGTAERPRSRLEELLSGDVSEPAEDARDFGPSRLADLLGGGVEARDDNERFAGSEAGEGSTPQSTASQRPTRLAEVLGAGAAQENVGDDFDAADDGDAVAPRHDAAPFGPRTRSALQGDFQPGGGAAGPSLESPVVAAKQRSPLAEFLAPIGPSENPLGGAGWAAPSAVGNRAGQPDVEDEDTMAEPRRDPLARPRRSAARVAMPTAEDDDQPPQRGAPGDRGASPAGAASQPNKFEEHLTGLMREQETSRRMLDELSNKSGGPARF